MSRKNKSELVRPTGDTRGALTRSGKRAGSRTGNPRSSGKKPSGTNLGRGGGSAAATAHNARSRSKSKSKRGG